MGRIQKFFKQYWLPILSGILMGTSYIPLPPWALAVCFAPLWFFVLTRAENWKQAFLAGWLSQFFLSLIGFYWVAFVAHEFGFLPWSVSAGVLLLFAAFVHTYFAFAAALGFWLRKRFRLPDLATLIVMISLVVLAEGWWPSLFPWNLGYPWLAARLPIAQIADTIGFLGLSWLTHFISALAAYLYIQRDRNLTLVTGLCGLMLFGFLSWVGVQKEKAWQVTDSQINVLQVQANIGNLEKVYSEKGVGFQQEILTQFFSLTREGLRQFPQTDMVIWPETAFPAALNDSERQRRYPAQFFQFIQEIKKPVMTGAFAKDPPEMTSPNEYNALFLFGENGEALAPAYHKTFLLAYGEYTPFVDVFPWLAKISPAGVGFAKGPGPTVIPFKDSKVGLQICYESLYPSFTQALSEMGATWLVNLTNDSWFGPTFEPWQHLYMTLARAIEARRPLVRSTNTGITTSILASGEILPLSPISQAWFGLNEIRYLKNPPQTFYVKYGGFLPLLLFIIILLPILLSILRSILPLDLFGKKNRASNDDKNSLAD